MDCTYYVTSEYTKKITLYKPTHATNNKAQLLKTPIKMECYGIL